MEQINILVTAAVKGEKNYLYPGCFPKIASISPHVRVTDASDFLAREQRGDSRSRHDFDALLNNTDVIFAMRLPQNILKRAPRVKWIQMMAAGVEIVLDNDMLNSPVILTNVSGIHVTTISEYILCTMLMFSKNMLFYSALKQEKKWECRTSLTLHGKTAGIIGLGHIGSAVARLAKCFGMNVIAIRRSATEGSRARYVDKLVPRDKLPELLTESDFVIITLPSTAETTHLIGKKELQFLKPTTVIINIGRGNIIDENALIIALEEQRIAGAALDVFSQEPLPAESRLWNMPNVILTPHIAGSMPDYSVRTTEIFCDNLKRFLAGKRLLHVVNKKRGY